MSCYVPVRLHKRAGRVLLQPDFAQASTSLFSKLEWISVFDLIKYKEVVLPNASKIDFNSSPFYVDLWAILQEPFFMTFYCETHKTVNTRNIHGI